PRPLVSARPRCWLNGLQRRRQANSPRHGSHSIRATMTLPCSWFYVIAALQTIQGDLGQSTLALLQSLQPLPVETVLHEISKRGLVEGEPAGGPVVRIAMGRSSCTCSAS